MMPHLYNRTSVLSAVLPPSPLALPHSKAQAAPFALTSRLNKLCHIFSTDAASQNHNTSKTTQLGSYRKFYASPFQLLCDSAYTFATLPDQPSQLHRVFYRRVVP